MPQNIVKQILSNMAWIEEVHQSDHDRWSTLKGILEGWTAQRSLTTREADSGMDGACGGGVNVEL